MVTMAGPELHDLDGVRPDVPIPLAPVAGPAEPLLRLLTGLREPSFAHARDVTLWWAAGAVAVLVTSATIIAAEYTRYMLAVGVLLAGYVVLRALALAVWERRQRAFESWWLEAQSERLRSHAFDVVGFRMEADPRLPDSDPEPYDLSRPDDVRRLLDRQAVERRRRLRSRVQIEFVYRPAGAGNPSIEHIRRVLTDIEVYPAAGPATRVRIRFPGARYGSQPAPPGGDRGRPGRRTYWFLAGPVRLTTTAPATS